MPETPTTPPPSMGRIVIFVDEMGATYPAIVRRSVLYLVELTALTALGTREVCGVPHAPEDERSPTTWHWPPRA